MKTTSILAAAALALAATTVSPAAEIHYKTVTLPEASIFYREAGDPSKPVILLLHGFPTSSHMFRDLIPELSGDFHVIAPDLPGFGFSSAPDHKEFQYTFDHLAEVMSGFVEKLKLEKFSIYIFDYGAPVGLRLALKYPDRISGSSPRMAMPTSKASRRKAGGRSRPTGTSPPRRIARPCASSSLLKRHAGSIPTA